MRRALWPTADEAELEALLDRSDVAYVVLVAERSDQGLCGFAEVGTRPYAEGCRGSPVAYLEGWFVETAARGAGVGRALVEAAEAWGRSRGCTEFASDAEPDNTISLAAHRALGFADMGLVRCFRKDI